VKNRILFISLAVVLALSMGLIGCGGEDLPPEAPDSIIVGSARDTDEGMEAFECYHGGPFMRYWVNKVNADGGIYLSEYEEKVELELVVREFSVGSWDIGTVVQGLIDDGASMIFGGPSTDTVYTLAPVCNKNSVILMSLEGGASKMVWEPEDSIDNWPYVWINLSFANWYEIPVLKGMLDEVVTGRDPIAYVTQIGGLGAEHGLEYLQTTVTEFGSGNVLPSDSGLEHAFFITAEDANIIIQGAMDALGDPANPNYDVFCAYTYPWNVAALFSAIQSFGFNPPAMIFGPGSSQGYFPLAWGDDAVEGIMSFGTANAKTTVNVGTPTISMADLYDEIGAQIEDDWVNYTVCPNSYGATHGTELLDFWGEPIFAAGLEMWRTAVEEVGDLDNTAIRDVMASFSESNPCSTCFGDTWYVVFGEDPVTGAPNRLGGGIVDYLCQTGQIGQWQSGIFEITGYDGITDDLPNYDATADFMYPMTDLWNWI